MAFKQKRIRQSQVPDFRISFLGTKDGKARIGVNARSVPNYVENVLITAPKANSAPLISFYSTVISFYTSSLGPLNRAKELSHFVPAHTDDPKFTSFNSPVLKGGEFLVPFEVLTYFWIQVPGRYEEDGFYLPDYTHLDNGLKLNFGPEVPKMDPSKRSGSSIIYKMYIPIFKVLVKKDSVETINYDPGELVFLSMGADNNRKIMDLSKMSSFYD